MITVVTPCWNQGQFLQRAIDSVLAQTYQNFEYILINDGSTDDTFDIICSQRDRRIRVIDLPKQPKVGCVLNHSIRIAHGNYWVWCPADDTFKPTLLEEHVKASIKYPQSVFYTGGELIDENDNLIGPRKITPRTPEEFAKIVWKDSPIGFTGIWIPMNVFDLVGNFPTHTYSEDFAWMIKATIHGVKFRCIEKYLYQKRIHTNRTTKRKYDTIIANVPRIRAELAIYKELFDG